MSTLKADAVTSSQDNTALTLSGRGTGGVKVNDFFVQTKGADISSATALTLGKDGNQFDVTGTTTIVSIATQGIGSYVTLHFDGALTFTHHSTNLILPGAANITTAAGDIAVMYEYASADWRCVSYTKASGAAVVAAGGGLIHLETVTASGATSIDFDASLSSTYDVYLIIVSEMFTQDVDVWIRTDSNGGDSFDAGSSDYTWGCELTKDDAVHNSKDVADNQINITGTHGSANPGGAAPTEEVGFLKIWINKPSGTVGDKMIWTEFFYPSADAEVMMHGDTIGRRMSSAAIDSIQILAASGNITGVARLYGITNG